MNNLIILIIIFSLICFFFVITTNTTNTGNTGNSRNTGNTGNTGILGNITETKSTVNLNTKKFDSGEVINDGNNQFTISSTIEEDKVKAKVIVIDDYIGLPYEAAKKIIDSAGFVNYIVLKVSSGNTDLPNVITEQTPSPGTTLSITYNSIVEITVKMGIL